MVTRCREEENHDWGGYKKRWNDPIWGNTRNGKSHIKKGWKKIGRQKELEDSFGKEGNNK